MSATKTLRIGCDWPGCYVRRDSGYSKAADARKALQAQDGWAFVDGMDLCGPPKEYESDRLMGSQWVASDHARAFREGPHRPDLERDGTGRRFRVRCTCGWVPHNPDQGVVLWRTRRNAVQSWRIRHLYDVVKEQQEAAAP